MFFVNLKKCNIIFRLFAQDDFHMKKNLFCNRTIFLLHSNLKGNGTEFKHKSNLNVELLSFDKRKTSTK